MKINISGLSEGVYQYDFSISAAELRLEPNYNGDVLTNITLEKSIHQIVATVKASVKGVFICDRCASEYSDEVRAQFTSVYTWEQTDDMEEDDDFRILRKDENVIDFSPSVKEYLMLAVPLKLLCKNNCVIPEHIEAKNTILDPRWEKLQALRQSENN
jgi:uncharacterized metal-binding protein YceD (DUF177 family)